MILEHFGDKARTNSYMSIEPVQSRHQSQTSIDGHLLSSIDSEARKARLGSQPTYSPSSTSITEISLADFNLLCMCFAIVFGQHTLSYFHIFHRKYI